MNAKKKGNHGENVFAEFLREHGFKAYRDSASGASQHKSDIVNGLDYSIEVKTVKRINLKEAWRQVSRDSSIAHNSPLLAIHLDSMPDKSWIICLSSEDWIDMEIKARQSPKIEVIGTNSVQDDRDMLFALASLKTAITRVNKLLEN